MKQRPQKIQSKKQSHGYRCYESTYNVKILNSFNPEPQFKDNESVITNKLKDLCSEVKEFKFVMLLALEFKRIESDDETKYSIFYLSSKLETILIMSDIDYVFESISSKNISNIH